MAQKGGKLREYNGCWETPHFMSLMVFSVSSHMGIRTVLGPKFTLSIKLLWNNIRQIAGFSRLVTWYVAVQNINNP